MNKPFIEIQKFDQKFIAITLWTTLLLSAFISLLIFFKEERNFVAFLPLYIILPVFILFKCLRLELKIFDSLIYFRFYPIQIKEFTIHKEDIRSITLTHYDPLKDYGGWGIRFGIKGNAYTVKGDCGINIILKNKRQILVGTQCYYEVVAILQSSYNDVYSGPRILNYVN